MVGRRFGSMSALLLSVLGLSMGMPHCPMWKAISPCTCRMDANQLTSIYCEKMTSYEQVVNLFKGHFAPTDRISLKVDYSSLEDLSYRTFKELNMSIEQLKLNHDDLRYLRGETFDGLTAVNYLSLADNALGMVPEELWFRMPNIKTLDLGRTRIQSLSDSSFSALTHLEVLVLPGNMITSIDRNSIPSKIFRLHLGRNYIRDLNGSLLNLSELLWLFVNANDLTTLENELPLEADNLKMIHAANNNIQKLPQQLTTYGSIEILFLQNNLIKALDGTLSRAKNLKRLILENNLVSTIQRDEFIECGSMESLILSHNQITSLNNSMINLRNLNFLDMSYNLLPEFSFIEVINLQELRIIDLSFNRISKIIGPATNLIDPNLKLGEIRLNNNDLESLDGALSGFPELLRLNLSSNYIKTISPDDFIGLDQLRLLDISNNQIKTLEETSRTFLPRLEELRASHNQLTILERDFHGLPVLCYADLSNNKIVALGRELVTKTRCKIGHGVHEATWDTLKIDLNDNPILCDAAMPEITSAMEVNHTRIFGVSYNCPPLNEQPVTSKPNKFLGYIPEINSPNPVVSENVDRNDSPENQVQQVKPFFKPGFQPLPLAISREIDPIQYSHEEKLVSRENRVRNASNILIDKTEKEDNKITVANVTENGVANSTVNQIQREEPSVTSRTQIDPEEQLNKMATEIELLKTQLDELANQNQLLAENLKQNRSIAEKIENR